MNAREMIYITHCAKKSIFVMPRKDRKSFDFRSEGNKNPQHLIDKEVLTKMDFLDPN